MILLRPIAIPYDNPRYVPCFVACGPELDSENYMVSVVEYYRLHVEVSTSPGDFFEDTLIRAGCVQKVEQDMN